MRHPHEISSKLEIDGDIYDEVKELEDVESPIRDDSARNPLAYMREVTASKPVMPLNALDGKAVGRRITIRGPAAGPFVPITETILELRNEDGSTQAYTLTVDADTMGNDGAPIFQIFFGTGGAQHVVVVEGFPGQTFSIVGSFIRINAVLIPLVANVSCNFQCSIGYFPSGSKPRFWEEGQLGIGGSETFNASNTPQNDFDPFRFLRDIGFYKGDPADTFTLEFLRGADTLFKEEYGVGVQQANPRPFVPSCNKIRITKSAGAGNGRFTLMMEQSF